MRRTSGEVAFDQMVIGERIEREAETVAIETGGADHGLTRPQLGVLVMDHAGAHIVATADAFTRHMTSRATDAARVITGRDRLFPLPMMG